MVLILRIELDEGLRGELAIALRDRGVAITRQTHEPDEMRGAPFVGRHVGRGQHVEDLVEEVGSGTRNRTWDFDL